MYPVVERTSTADAADAVQGAHPPVFDPGSDLFVAQFDRPADLQQVNMRALSPFHRALLVIDGTVTTFLEAYMLEPIDVVKVGQVEQELATASPWLDLDAGARVVARQVTIQGRYSGRVVRPRRLDDRRRPPARRHGGRVGRLGRWAGQGPQRGRGPRAGGRSCGTVGSGHPPGGRPDTGPGGDLIVRTYRIIQGGSPIMLINEKFPTAEPGPPAHD